MNRNQKVLVVDDEEINQSLVSEILGDLVNFRIVSTGEQALEAMHDYLPDLILLDVMMSGIDGIEVCRRIRSEAKFDLVKILLVSGKTMSEERLAGYEVGADDYITKPFVPEELMAKAKVFLRLTEVEKELRAANRMLNEKVQERTIQLIESQSRLQTMPLQLKTHLETVNMLAFQIQDEIRGGTEYRELVAEPLALMIDILSKMKRIMESVED